MLVEALAKEVFQQITQTDAPAFGYVKGEERLVSIVVDHVVVRLCCSLLWDKQTCVHTLRSVDQVLSIKRS
jgi:hypothetical protein